MSEDSAMRGVSGAGGPDYDKMAAYAPKAKEQLEKTAQKNEILSKNVGSLQSNIQRLGKQLELYQTIAKEVGLTPEQTARVKGMQDNLIKLKKAEREVVAEKSRLITSQKGFSTTLKDLSGKVEAFLSTNTSKVRRGKSGSAKKTDSTEQPPTYKRLVAQKKIVDMGQKALDEGQIALNKRLQPLMQESARSAADSENFGLQLLIKEYRTKLTVETAIQGKFPGPGGMLIKEVEGSHPRSKDIAATKSDIAATLKELAFLEVDVRRNSGLRQADSMKKFGELQAKLNGQFSKLHQLITGVSAQSRPSKGVIQDTHGKDATSVATGPVEQQKTTPTQAGWQKVLEQVRTGRTLSLSQMQKQEAASQEKIESLLGQLGALRYAMDNPTPGPQSGIKDEYELACATLRFYQFDGDSGGKIFEKAYSAAASEAQAAKQAPAPAEAEAAPEPVLATPPKSAPPAPAPSPTEAPVSEAPPSPTRSVASEPSVVGEPLVRFGSDSIGRARKEAESPPSSPPPLARSAPGAKASEAGPLVKSKSAESLPKGHKAERPAFDQAKVAARGVTAENFQEFWNGKVKAAASFKGTRLGKSSESAAKDARAAMRGVLSQVLEDVAEHGITPESMKKLQAIVTNLPSDPDSAKAVTDLFSDIRGGENELYKALGQEMQAVAKGIASSYTSGKTHGKAPDAVLADFRGLELISSILGVPLDDGLKKMALDILTKKFVEMGQQASTVSPQEFAKFCEQSSTTFITKTELGQREGDGAVILLSSLKAEIALRFLDDPKVTQENIKEFWPHLENQTKTEIYAQIEKMQGKSDQMQKGSRLMKKLIATVYKQKDTPFATFVLSKRGPENFYKDLTESVVQPMRKDLTTLITTYKPKVLKQPPAAQGKAVFQEMSRTFRAARFEGVDPPENYTKGAEQYVRDLTQLKEQAASLFTVVVRDGIEKAGISNVDISILQNALQDPNTRKTLEKAGIDVGKALACLARIAHDIQAYVYENLRMSFEPKEVALDAATEQRKEVGRIIDEMLVPESVINLDNLKNLSVLLKALPVPPPAKLLQLKEKVTGDRGAQDLNEVELTFLQSVASIEKRNEKRQEAGKVLHEMFTTESTLNQTNLQSLSDLLKVLKAVLNPPKPPGELTPVQKKVHDVLKKKDLNVSELVSFLELAESIKVESDKIIAALKILKQKEGGFTAKEFNQLLTTSPAFLTYSLLMTEYVPRFDKMNAQFADIQEKIGTDFDGFKEGFSSTQPTLTLAQAFNEIRTTHLMAPVQRMPRWKLLTEAFAAQSEKSLPPNEGNAFKEVVMEIPVAAAAVVNEQIRAKEFRDQISAELLAQQKKKSAVS